MPKEYSRTERVADQIQRELAQLIQREVKDPRLPVLVTVSAVKISKDLSHAKIYITVFDKDKNKQIDQALEILNHAAGFLRTCLARILKLRVTPKLYFVHDVSVEYGSHLSDLIDQVASDNDEE